MRYRCQLGPNKDTDSESRAESSMDVVENVRRYVASWNSGGDSEWCVPSFHLPRHLLSKFKPCFCYCLSLQPGGPKLPRLAHDSVPHSSALHVEYMDTTPHHLALRIRRLH
jgi:hypothetical protein